MPVTKKLAANMSFIVSIAVFCLVMLGGMLVHVMPHLGWIIDGVRSGSMSPALERGSLVIAGPVDPSGIAIGDIVIFRNEAMTDNYICHRVIGKTLQPPLLFTTRGDANPFADPEPVPAANIIAKVNASVPVLGFAAIFIKTPVGFVVSVIVPGVIIAVMCLATIFTELFRKKSSSDHAG